MNSVGILAALLVLCCVISVSGGPNTILDDLEPLHWWTAGIDYTGQAGTPECDANPGACLQDRGSSSPRNPLVFVNGSSISSTVCGTTPCVRIQSCSSWLRSAFGVDAALAGSAVRTITAWFKTEISPASATAIQPVVSLGFGGTGDCSSLSTFELVLYGYSGTFRTCGDGVSGPAAIVEGMWTHLAVSYDGTIIKVFVNGEAVGSRTIPLQVNPSLFVVGRDSTGEHGSCALTIADVRVYTAVLSQAQIEQLNVMNDLRAVAEVNPILDIQPLHWWMPGVFAPKSALCPTSQACLRDIGSAGTTHMLMSYRHSFTVQSDCPFGQCLRMDSCYSNLQSVADYEPTVGGASPRTWTMWFNLHNFHGFGFPQTLFSMGSIFLDGSDDAHGAVFAVAVFSGQVTFVGYGVDLIATNVLENTWNHVAVSYNGTTLAVYVNGVPVKQTMVLSTRGYNKRLDIGVDTGWQSYYYRACYMSFTDVRVYTQALSDDQVRLLYLHQPAPVSAALLTPAPTVSNLTEQAMSIQCSVRHCTLHVSLDNREPFSVTVVDAATFAVFDATWIVEAPILSAAKYNALFPVALELPMSAMVQVDGKTSMSFVSAGSVPLPTSTGQHNVTVWALDPLGGKQPVPHGFAWTVDADPLQLQPPTAALPGWFVLHANKAADVWIACFHSDTMNCSIAALALPALKVPLNEPGTIQVTARDCAGRSNTTATAVLALPRPSWSALPRLGAVVPVARYKIRNESVEPHSDLLVRFSPVAPWQPSSNLTISLSDVGDTFLQSRLRRQSVLGPILTTAWRVENCSASLDFASVWRASPCADGSGRPVFCTDEPVLLYLASTCAAPLQLSVNGGHSWSSVAPGVVRVDAPASTAVVAWVGHSTATAFVSWTRKPVQRFGVQLRLDCRPDATTTNTFAMLCVSIAGWLPSGAAMQSSLDRASWQSLSSPVTVFEGLAQGKHSCAFRIWDPSKSAILALTSVAWEVLPAVSVVRLMWVSVPSQISWASLDELRWTSRTAVSHYLIEVDGAAPTNSTAGYTAVDGSSSQLQRRCVRVAGVSAVGLVGSWLQHCWWSCTLFMLVHPVASTGGETHDRFLLHEPISILWQPVAAENGVHAVQYTLLENQALAPSLCVATAQSILAATWRSADDMLTSLDGLPLGVHTILVQSLTKDLEPGSAVCHILRVVLSSPPVQMLLAPPSVTVEPQVLFKFSADWCDTCHSGWFECQFASNACGAWWKCLSPLPVGPLNPGEYVLRIRTNHARYGPGEAVTHRWRVIMANEAKVVLTGLSEGQHTVRITPQDAYGNLGTQLVSSFQIDTSPPLVVSVQLSPNVFSAAGSTLLFTRAPRIGATVLMSDLPRSAACTDCTFQVNMTHCTTTRCASRISMSAELEFEDENLYIVVVTPIDGVHQAGLPWTRVVQFDQSPPHTVLDLSSAAYRWGTLLVLRHLQTDWILHSEPFGSAQLMIDGDTVWTATQLGVDGQGVARGISAASLAAGLHIAAAFSSDAAHNVDDVGMAVSFIVDTDVPVSSLGMGSVLRGMFARTSTVSVILTAADATTAVSHWNMNFADTVVQINATVADAAKVVVNHTMWLEHLPDGLYTLAVQAVDLAGNVEPVGPTISWIVDTTPPTSAVVVAAGPLTNSSVLDVTVAGFDASHIQFWSVAHSGPAAVFNETLSAVNDVGHFHSPHLADGVHTFSFTAVDWAGWASETRNSVTVAVDTTPPATYLAMVPAVAVSNATRFSFSLRGQDVNGISRWHLVHTSPNASESHVIHCTNSNSTGWVTIQAREEGAHVVRAFAVDAAGNQDTVGYAISWIVDRTAPPYCVIDSGAGPYAAVQNVTYTVAGHDVGSSIRSWQLSVNLAAHPEERSSGGRVMATNNSASLAISLFSEGLHDIRLQPEDLAGNTNFTGCSQHVTLDTSAPVTLFRGTPGGPDFLLNSTSAQLDLLGQDNVTFVALWKVTHIGPADTAATVQIVQATENAGNVSFSHLSEGGHTIQAEAQDAAGNWELRPATVTWVVDVTAPISSIHPVLPPVHGRYVTHPEIRLLLHSEDALSQIQRWICSHWFDRQQLDGFVIMPSVSSPNDTLVTLTGLADGLHTLEARAVDAAGNEQKTASAWTWVVDTTAPISRFARTMPHLVNVTKVSVVVRGIDTNGIVAWTVSYSGPGATLPSLLTADHNQGTFDVVDLAEGSHLIMIAAIDDAGLAELQPLQWSFAVDVSSPVTEAQLASPAPVTAAATALVLLGGQDLSGVCAWQVSHTLQNATQLTAVVNASKASSFSLLSPSDGVNWAHVAAIDCAGNKDPTGVSLQWVTDTTPPFLCTATVAGGRRLKGRNATMVLQGFDTSSSVVGWRFRVNSSAPAFIGTVWSRGDDAVVPTHFQVDGYYQITAIPVDAAGNANETGCAVAVIVDTGLPMTVKFVAVNLGSPINVDSIEFQLEGHDSLSRIVEWIVQHVQPSGDSTAASHASNADNIAGFTEQEPAEGLHTWTARAVDEAGNVEALGPSVQLLIDRQPPASVAILLTPAVVNATATVVVQLTGSDSLTWIDHWDVEHVGPDIPVLPGAVRAAANAAVLRIVGAPAGTHALRLRAIDAAGNAESEYQVVSWVADFLPPTTVAKIASSCPCAQGSVRVLLNGTDAESGIVEWRFHLEWSDATTGMHGSRSWARDAASHVLENLTLHDLPQGHHTLMVQAADAAGNVDPTGSVLRWVIDLTAPSSSAAADVPVSSFTNHTTVDLALAGEDSLSAVRCWRLDHVAPSEQLVSALTCTTPLQLSNLTDGQHTVIVHAIDGAGNQDPAGFRLNWTVDTVPPHTAAMLLTPSLTNASWMTVALDGSDATIPVSGWLIVHKRGSQVVEELITTKQSLRVALDDDGVHTIWTRAVDQAGNVDLTGSYVTVSRDTVPPSCQFALYPAVEVPSLDVAISVNCTEPALVEVQLVAVDEGLTAQVVSYLHAHDAYKHVLEFRVVQDGTFAFCVSSMDMAANRQSYSVVGSAFVVDTKPPTIQLLRLGDTITRPASEGYWTAAAAVPLHFVVQDAGNRSCSSCILRAVTWSADDAVPIILTATGASGVISVPLSADGLHVLLPQAIDSVGNLANGTMLSLIRDTVGPVVTVDPSVPQNAVTNASFITLSVRSQEFDCLLRVSGAVQLQAPLPCQIVIPLQAQGQICVDLVVTDAVGNIGVGPRNMCWIHDSIPPVSRWNSSLAAYQATRNVFVAIHPQEPGLSYQLVTTRVASGDATWRACVELQCFATVPSDGVWRIETIATDAAGNTELAPLAATVHVDMVAPAIALRHDVNYTLSALRDNAPWAAQFSVADSSPVQASAVLHSSGAAEADALAVTCDPSAAWCSASIPILPDGVHTLHLVATDAADLCSTVDWTWTVDTHPPVLANTTLTPPDVPGNEVEPPSYRSLADLVLTTSCVDTLTPCDVSATWELRQSLAADPCLANTSSPAGPQAAPLTFQQLQTRWVLAGLRARDGLYLLTISARDQTHNTRSASWLVAQDSTAPSRCTLNPSVPDGQHTVESNFRAEILLSGDPSPRQDLLLLWYQLDQAAPEPVLSPVMVGAGTGFVTHQGLVELSGLADGHHVLAVWATDATGHAGTKASSQWTVSSAAPETVVEHVPSADADIGMGVRWRFHFQGVQVGASAIARIEVQADGSQTWDTACHGPQACEFEIEMRKPGARSLKIAAVNDLGVADSTPELVTWTVRQCGPKDMSTIDAVTGIVVCQTCPDGGDCQAGAARPHEVVAKPGFWASKQTSAFYACPVIEACPGGDSANATVAKCTPGYSGVLCALCDSGYFLQFGRCVQCAGDPAVSWMAMLGISFLLMAAGGLIFAFRDVLPQTVMKITLAMLQIVASANTSFIAPWPDTVVAFLSGLKIFMLELLSLTRTSCAVPVTFYTSFSFSVFGMTTVTLLLLIALGIRQLLSVSRSAAGSILKPLLVFWLVCYPAVSLKLLQVFDCVEVEGSSLLAADMRLPCHDSTWNAFAAVSVLYLLAFTVGLPTFLFVILYRRRNSLDNVATVREAGFLYKTYGTHAYAWEAAELLRKLVLTSGLTLFDQRTPVPLTLAVLVSALAHVQHAAFKPFVQRRHYLLQHVSLAVTTAVFTIGLMFKTANGSLSATINLFLTAAIILGCAFTFACVLLTAMWDVRESIAARRHAALEYGKTSTVPRNTTPSMSAGLEAAPIVKLAPVPANFHLNPLHQQRQLQKQLRPKPPLSGFAPTTVVAE